MDTESGNAMKKLWIKFVNWVKYLFRRPNKPCERAYRYVCCVWAKSR